jgi:hypothetical protein
MQGRPTDSGGTASGISQPWLEGDSARKATLAAVHAWVHSFSATVFSLPDLPSHRCPRDLSFVEILDA